jgi:nicotinamide riboside kinase
MRIGCIGAGGTGKTTLVTALAKVINLPVHSSINRAVFAQFNQTQVSHQDLTAAERWQIQFASFNAKIAQDATNPLGIFERTLLDHYMYCLLYCNSEITDMQHSLMLTQVINNLASYDCLYYFPIYSWVVANLVDGFREAGMANRTCQELLLTGFLARNIDPVSIFDITIMPDCGVKSRVEVILAQLPDNLKVI